MPSSQEKHSYDSNDSNQHLPMYHTRHDNDEATAPLYDSLGSTSKPTLPEKTASPSEVTEFITQLLIVTRDLPSSQAQEIASRWTFGTGDDLLNTYPVQMYREIFGSESGWMVYKEVMLLNYENTHPERNHRRYGLTGLAICIPVMIAVVLLGPPAVRADSMLPLYIVVFGGMFSAAGILISFIMAVAPKRTPLKIVESELSGSFFKGAQRQGSSS